jgi:putative peptidoglycan lipid II flippase
MYPFDRIHVGPTLSLGAVGLGIGASIAGWIEWWILRRSLSRSVGHVGAGSPALIRMFAAAAIAMVAGRGIAMFTPEMSPMLRSLVVLAPAGLLYLAIAYAMGLPQARQMVRRVIRR